VLHRDRAIAAQPREAAVARQHALVDEFLDEVGLGAVERDQHDARRLSPVAVVIVVAVAITVVIVIAGIARTVVAMVATGARRRRDAGQRYGERHRRYQGEQTLPVHVVAPVNSAICAVLVVNGAPTIGLG